LFKNEADVNESKILDVDNDGIMKNFIGKIIKYGKLVGNQRGYSLIEVLVAIAILAAVLSAFVGALSISLQTQVTIDEKETAKNLAESQMEYVKGQPFAATYNPAAIPASYIGYSVNINTGSITARDTNLQKVTVVIAHYNKQITQLVDFKVK